MLRARISEARSRLGEVYTNARERIGDAYTKARKNVVAGAKYTDETIREKPYQSMAVALGVGVLVGVLIGRSSKD